MHRADGGLAPKDLLLINSTKRQAERHTNKGCNKMVRLPTTDDFASLEITLSLVFPSPPESTTAILLLFHGFGDSEAPFAAFARSLSLPGVLAISVRGPRPLPPTLMQSDDDDDDDEAEVGAGGSARHFHWGDDIKLSGDELDPDPGFEGAAELVAGRLVRDTLVGRCGWSPADVLLFGFGQGGSFALALASLARDVVAFKGVISVGGPLLPSAVPSTRSAREKAATPVLVCHGSASEAVDEEAVDVLRREFSDVRVVPWSKADDSMPRNREEMLALMQFIAERLKTIPV